MPTIISHAVVAWATGKSIYKTPKLKILIAGMICSMIPDADVIGFRFGVPYESMFGHRGFTHSIVFALLLSAIATFLFRDKINNPKLLFFFFFAATVSHPLLDALTNGGHGVALLAPFSNHRYFFPWTPIKVSPIGASKFLSEYGLSVLLSEIKWVWIPSALALIFSRRLFSKT